MKLTTAARSGLDGAAVEMLREVAQQLPEEQRADLLVESVRAILHAANGGDRWGPYVNPEGDGIRRVLDAATAHRDETTRRQRDREERGSGH